MSFRKLLDGPHQEAEKKHEISFFSFYRTIYIIFFGSQLVLLLQMFMLVPSKKIKYTHHKIILNVVFVYRSL